MIAHIQFVIQVHLQKILELYNSCLKKIVHAEVQYRLNFLVQQSLAQTKFRAIGKKVYLSAYIS